jgi:hypothetical protein
MAGKDFIGRCRGFIEILARRWRGESVKNGKNLVRTESWQRFQVGIS